MTAVDEARRLAARQAALGIPGEIVEITVSLVLRHDALADMDEASNIAASLAALAADSYGTRLHDVNATIRVRSPHPLPPRIARH